MWIRSQNRERLLKCNDVYVVNGYTSGDSGTWTSDGKKRIIMCNGIDFATYTSSKRALEVLDEIQIAVLGKVLIPTPMFGGDAEDYNKIETLSIVYEMPKE